jgi:hypothetical protein
MTEDPEELRRHIEQSRRKVGGAHSSADDVRQAGSSR